MWIGFDDTDSRMGGCTTYVAFEIIQQLIKNGFMLVGFPRLVRLNPEVPWKTRGNGAIAFQIGKGSGSETCFAEKENDLFYFDSKQDDTFEMKDISFIQSIVHDTIQNYAEFDSKNTNPAYVICKEKLSSDLYRKAVHELVDKDMVIQEINHVDGLYHLFKNGRGIIGACAAISWDQSNDHTYELISYRLKQNWKTDRFVDDQSVIAMDKKHDSTFNNFDYENKYNCIVPHSPCPILFGIRGDDPAVLSTCQQMITSEPIQGWMIFASNQGTDDHLRQKQINKIQPYTSVIVQGTVSTIPKRIPGGHVIFSLTDEEEISIDCAAYEPTKQFRAIISQLDPGELIEVYGGIREEPITINIEKINILSLVDVFEKIENPVCPVCGKHMRSKGLNQGYKCKTCKTTADNPIKNRKKRTLQIGFYEVPICARRHLSKPLKRMK